MTTTIDKGTIAYLQALKNAGSDGFTPIGQLYYGILMGLAYKGLVYSNGRGTFFITEFGAEQLRNSELLEQ